MDRNRFSAIAHRTLWKLILDGCEVQTMPALATPKLLILHLQRNRITRTDGLDGKLPELRKIVLSNNKITTLAGFGRLAALEELWLDGRCINAIDATTDRNLRALGGQLSLRLPRSMQYAAFAATKTISPLSASSRS